MITFTCNDEDITISQVGYGQYRVEGWDTSFVTQDKELVDGCLDNDEECKQEIYDLLYDRK